jgi:hypothetical protein
MTTQYSIDISSVISKFGQGASVLPEEVDDRSNNHEFTPIIPQLDSYTAEHIIFIDNRPIHLVRFLPYYDPLLNQTLFTIQYVYLNETDNISFQVTVTKNGYGYSTSGRKYDFKCIKKE